MIISPTLAVCGPSTKADLLVATLAEAAADIPEDAVAVRRASPLEPCCTGRAERFYFLPLAVCSNDDRALMERPGAPNNTTPPIERQVFEDELQSFD